MRFVALCLLTLALLAPAALATDDRTVGPLHLEQPWTRVMPEGRAMGGGYLTIRNAGPEADRLVAVSTPRAGRVELHETTIVEDVMRMRPLPDGLPVPAGDSVELKPGGLHIMFLDVETPFVEGERIPVVLTFEKNGEAELGFVVRGGAAQGHGAAHGHGASEAHGQHEE